MNIKELKELRKLKRMTYTELSKRSGVPLRTLENIFSGKTEYPRVCTMTAIETALGGCDKVEESISSIGGYPLSDTRAIPLVGQVVAGKPIETTENLEGYIMVDYKNPEDYFALRVKGKSMINAHIFPDSILVVRKQNFADNGDIIVCAIDGESTVKRFLEKDGNIVLLPENSEFTPILVNKFSDFYIFGKVIEIRTKL